MQIPNTPRAEGFGPGTGDLVDAPDAELTREFYHRVLVPAFPPKELESWETFEECLAAERGEPGRGIATVLLDETGRVPIGGTVRYWYPDSRTWLLGYLAVADSHRRRGIGRKLIQDTARRWAQDDETVLGVAEVEDPRFFDGDMPLFRARMYSHAGGRVLAPHFTQPKVDEDKERVQDLMLLCLYAGPAALTAGGHRVRAEAVRAFIAEYFVAAEGVGVDVTDPDVLSLLGRFRDGADLPLLDINEFMPDR